MAKRKKKKRRRRARTKSKQPQLTTSQHTNLPRFLTMLAVGLALLGYGLYITGRGVGVFGAEPPPQAELPADSPAPVP